MYACVRVRASYTQTYTVQHIRSLQACCTCSPAHKGKGLRARARAREILKMNAICYTRATYPTGSVYGGWFEGGSIIPLLTLPSVERAQYLAASTYSLRKSLVFSATAIGIGIGLSYPFSICQHENNLNFKTVTQHAVRTDLGASYTNSSTPTM